MFAVFAEHAAAIKLVSFSNLVTKERWLNEGSLLAALRCLGWELLAAGLSWICPLPVSAILDRVGLCRQPYMKTNIKPGAWKHTHTSTLTHNLTLLATRLTYLRFARAHLRSVDLKLFLQKATPNGPSTNTYVSLPVVLAKRVRFMKDTYPVSSEDIVLSIPCWNFLINVWEIHSQNGKNNFVHHTNDFVKWLGT